MCVSQVVVVWYLRKKQKERLQAANINDPNAQSQSSLFDSITTPFRHGTASPPLASGEVKADESTALLQEQGQTTPP